MKHKFFLTLLLLLAATTATAHDFEVDGIYFNIINGNEVAVTYKGQYYNSYSKEYSGHVTIPASVTFNGTTYSVTSIGISAFNGCSGLTNVTIPNSVTSIDNSAFYSCYSLWRVTIPNSVTAIGDEVFSNCSGLTSIKVESGNTEYDSRENCNAIIETASNTLITGCMYTIIPNSVTAIGNYAFYGCSDLTDMTIPNSVTRIGERAFYGCSGLTSVTIGNSVTSIGEFAFFYCHSLTSVTIPNSVTTIGDGAFNGCFGLTDVTIPNSVITIGGAAFSDCEGLTSVTIGNSVTSIGEAAFNACFALTSVVIPNSVISIGDYAFYGGRSLTSVIIGNSVTSIGDYAFGFCGCLTSIKVESGNTEYDSRENCNAIIETASNTLIAGCMNSVIPNTVTSIGRYAFYGCTGLTSVTIPISVTTIGDGAFEECSGLTDVYSLIVDPSKVSKGSYVFYVYNENSPSGSFDYSGRTLHVPAGSLASYQSHGGWYPYFGQIVEIEPIVVHGDIDGDGRLAISDVSELIDIILEGTATIESLPSADVNGDGVISIADLADLIDLILTSNQ